MGSLKLLCALTAASLVLPSRVLVEAAPHPYALVVRQEPSDVTPDTSQGSNSDDGTPPSSGQIALQLPNLGLDGITDAGLGVVGNITSGTDSTSPSSSPSLSSTALLARKLNLTSHWQAPLPPPGSTVQSYEFIADKWQLWHNRLYGGQESNLHLIQDPFFTPGITTGAASANSSTGGNANGGGEGASTVLQVDYQTGTYRQGGPHSEGGATFFPYPMEMKSSNKILLRYEVAFKHDFDFVKGGKLPGLFNGLQERDCSGGSKADDDQCFSVRMMWRENGLGEVYAYLPSSNNICPSPQSPTNGSTNGNNSNTTSTYKPTTITSPTTTLASDIICNSDYGTSIGRGKFSFSKGSYNPITMYIALNSAASARDGIIQVWANDTLVVDMQELLLSTESTPGDMNALKIFFSTFFGGSTAEWASRQDTSTYFRNLEIYTDSSSMNLGMNDNNNNNPLTGRYNSAEGKKSHAPPAYNVSQSRSMALLIAFSYCLAILAALYL